jgi:hypothetical protein
MFFWLPTMKTTVISVLDTQKDAHGGSGPSR